jgi:hypothetical protein
MNSDRDEYIQVPRAQWEQVADLIAGGHEHDERVRRAAHDAGVAEGRAVKIGHGYETGYELGHDTGLSARQDTRAYVHGILEGWDAGCQARHELAEELLHRPLPEQERETEAEAEVDDADFEAAS